MNNQEIKNKLEKLNFNTEIKPIEYMELLQLVNEFYKDIDNTIGRDAIIQLVEYQTPTQCRLVISDILEYIESE